MKKLLKVFNNSIAVCFSCNNYYFEYLVVCIHSLIKYSNKDQNYDIVILENDITENNKLILKKYEKDNISIRFCNVSNILKNLDVKFNINFHFALENYFRIFIPHIFKDYTKVLYLDCDAVLCTDVANIYNLSLDDKMIGAVKDFIVINEVISKNDYQYYYNQLKLKQPMDYINSGVLLLDIKKLLDFDFTNKCIDLIRDFVPKFVDQCIINKVADGNIKFLDAKYNSSSALDELLAVNNKKMNLPNELYEQYKKSLINPYFVHFMSNLKPWNSLWIKNSDLFWSIARQTEVYEKILYKNIYNYKAVEKDILIDIVKFNKNKFLYYCYVILSKIIFGKKRKVYKQNKNELKAKLKQVKFFLR